MKTIQLTNPPTGGNLNSTIRTAATELASVQAGCGVNSLFRPSVVDTTTGRHGIRWLIARILTERGAVLPMPSITLADGTVVINMLAPAPETYISKGMTSDEIITAVRSVNGFDKYPDATIRQNLSVVMARDGQIGAIEMHNSMDSARHCKRPRVKYYLVDVNG